MDKSLVTRHDVRFRLLETTKQFAAQRLRASGRTASVETAHTRLVVDQVRTARLGLHGPDEAHHVAALDAFWPEVRATYLRALATADVDTLVTIVTELALEGFYRRPEVFIWTTEALELCRDRAGARTHELLGAGALAAMAATDHRTAIELGEAALAEDPVPGTALDCLPEAVCGPHSWRGRGRESAAVSRRALDGLARLDDPWNESIMRGNLAVALFVVATEEGRTIPDEALEAGAAAVRTARRSGSPTAVANALLMHAVPMLKGQPDAARLLLEEAVNAAAAVDHAWIEAMASTWLAQLQVTAGHPTAGFDAYLRVGSEMHRRGWTFYAWFAAQRAAAVALALDRAEDAMLLAGWCDAAPQFLPWQYTSTPDLSDDDPNRERFGLVRQQGALLSLPEVIDRVRGHETTDT